MSADATGLTGPEVVTLLLPIDLLQRYTAGELAKARRASNAAKTAAMVAMQEQIAGVRVKILRMQGAPIRD